MSPLMESPKRLSTPLFCKNSFFNLEKMSEKHLPRSCIITNHHLAYTLFTIIGILGDMFLKRNVITQL